MVSVVPGDIRHVALHLFLFVRNTPSVSVPGTIRKGVCMCVCVCANCKIIQYVGFPLKH